MQQEYVIEFRSGSFFQNLEADNGGKMATAQRFASKKKADDFMREHEWISFNGDMAMAIDWRAKL